jgi:glycosyltransferase involved in cell wall biosynthesis
MAARDGQPLVGFLGRFSPEKGPLLLLDALVRLREAGVPFRAALVGDGPLAGAIQERVTSTRLGERVVVRPFTGTVAPILAALDVYVLPSLWESMPIGVLEAMSAGLPVVAADAGGVREAVSDGETGLLHPRGDVERLSSALGRLLLDRELRCRMGAAGRARQASMFSLEAMLDGIEHAYERALGV